MPPWPFHSTLGALATGVFWPLWVTSHTGPTFSVISIRPSGRKARRQGRLKLATWVMVKGRLASGFWSPRLTWAWAADAAVAISAAASAIFTSFILSLPGIPARGRPHGQAMSKGIWLKRLTGLEHRFLDLPLRRLAHQGRAEEQ